jgi:DMSO/TMAO reductase YedYZ molybdopterin-dependent catalytic subunit
MPDHNLTPRQQEEARLRMAQRLPPGQSLTRKFPVLHFGDEPRVDLNTWTFRIWGEVEEPREWNWEEFNRLPRTKLTLDLHCVTRWSMFDTEWDGVSLRSLVDAGLVKLKPSAHYVIQHCEQGYTTNTPLELALSDNMLMATHYDGKPLDLDHGYPLRMVIGVNRERPQNTTAYLWKGGKWLRGLEFVREDRLGFWERAGYHNEADPWREQRFARG